MLIADFLGGTLAGWGIFLGIVVLGVLYGIAQRQRDKDLEAIRRNTEAIRRKAEERD